MVGKHECDLELTATDNPDEIEQLEKTRRTTVFEESSYMVRIGQEITLRAWKNAVLSLLLIKLLIKLPVESVWSVREEWNMAKSFRK